MNGLHVLEGILKGLFIYLSRVTHVIHLIEKLFKFLEKTKIASKKWLLQSS